MVELAERAAEGSAEVEEVVELAERVAEGSAEEGRVAAGRAGWVVVGRAVEVEEVAEEKAADAERH